MGNVIDFILKLTDQLSPAMRSAAGACDSSTTRIANDLQKVTAGSNHFKYSLTELQGKLAAINSTRMTTHIASQFKLATTEARKLERQIDRLENRGRRSAGGSMLGGGLLSMLGGIGLTAGGIGIARAGMDREQLLLGYEVMLKSKADADKLTKDIVGFANVTPFTSSDIFKNTQMLLQYGAATKDTVIPTIRMLGDVSMGNAEKLGLLSLAYSQTQSAGRLLGQDMRQYTDAGFNPLKAISEQTGESLASLRDKMQKGAISADMVTQAFKYATGAGGMFYKMMERQSQTAAGKWSTTLDKMQNLVIKLGIALLPVVNAIGDLINKILDGDPVLNGLIATIGTAVIVTYAWSGAVGILNAVMALNPIVALIALVGGIAIGMYKANHKTEDWADSLKNLWHISKDVIGLLTTGFAQAFETIVYGANYLWIKLKEIRDQTYHWTLVSSTDNYVSPYTTQLKALEAHHDALKTQRDQTMAGYRTDIGDRYGNGADIKAARFSKMQEDADAMYAKYHGGKKPAAPGGAIAGVGGDSLDFSGKSKADAINSGGQRSIVINIGKQIEKLEIHTMTAKEGVSEMGAMIREELKRVLYSVNSMEAA